MKKSLLKARIEQLTDCLHRHNVPLPGWPDADGVAGTATEEPLQNKVRRLESMIIGLQDHINRTPTVSYTVVDAKFEGYDRTLRRHNSEIKQLQYKLADLQATLEVVGEDAPKYEEGDDKTPVTAG